MLKRRTSGKFRLLFECIPHHEIDDFPVDEYTRVYGVVITPMLNMARCHIVHVVESQRDSALEKWLPTSSLVHVSLEGTYLQSMIQCSFFTVQATCCPTTQPCLFQPRYRLSMQVFIDLWYYLYLKLCNLSIQNQALSKMLLTASGNCL